MNALQREIRSLKKYNMRLENENRQLRLQKENLIASGTIAWLLFITLSLGCLFLKVLC